MKIRLLIENAYVSGGTGRTTLNTAGALARRGHDVEVVSVHRRRGRPFFPVPRRVKLRVLVDLYSLRRRAEGALRTSPRTRLRLWAASRPSLVYTANDTRYHAFTLASDVRLMRYLRSVDDGVLVGTRPGLNIAIARWAQPSVVKVGQDHMNLGRYNPRLRGEIEKYYGGLDALVTLTGGDGEEYASLLGDSARVLAIPNGVPSVRGAVASPEQGNKIVIAAGRLSRQKGYDRLIRAWAIVARKHPDWRLHIYGTPREPLRTELQARIDKAGLGSVVYLMGVSTRIHARMAEASIYVLSSRFEGLPMALLEAMKIGLPVVAFNCPTGPADVIDHDRDGLLVENGNVRALAAAIVALIEDPERRMQLGAAARVKAAEFDTDEIAVRWENLFTELAAAKQPAGATRSRSWFVARLAAAILGGTLGALARKPPATAARASRATITAR